MEGPQDCESFTKEEIKALHLGQATFQNSDKMMNKVIEDIRFLQNRIERMKQLQTPNSTVLKTYQSMLSARESVLTWLNESQQADNPNDLGKFG